MGGGGGRVAEAENGRDKKREAGKEGQIRS